MSFMRTIEGSGAKPGIMGFRYDIAVVILGKKLEGEIQLEPSEVTSNLPDLF
jgi:hypothetical protein